MPDHSSFTNIRDRYGEAIHEQDYRPFRSICERIESTRVTFCDMPDVTQILNDIEDGDPSAAEELLPLIYNELRKLAAAKMANESPDHTLQATALVHEAYVRLVGTDDSGSRENWNGRGHFFASAAEAMR